MQLALRNRIAAWLLDGLTAPPKGDPVRALLRFAAAADETGHARTLTAEEAAALDSPEALFAVTPRGVRLRVDLLADLDALRRRARRFEQALLVASRTCGPRPGAATEDAVLAWTLSAAGALFNAELFFEVHEILEPAWHGSQGPLRTFLQGLIQVAVGFHHRASGNRGGAASLLAEGNAKLRPFVPEAWGVELSNLCAEVDRAVAVVRGKGSGPAPAPRLVSRSFLG